MCSPMLAELTRAVEEAHPWTHGHGGWDDEELATLRIGSLLHDVEKVAVAPAILGKPGRLTPVELHEVRA